MRVSDNMVSTLMSEHLIRKKSALYELQYRAASGKKVNRPSDDPGAYELIRRIKAGDACMEQRLRNCEGARLDLTMIEGVLGGITDVLQRATEITVTASDGTKTPTDREALGKEVNMLLDQLLDLANTQYGGRYIFSGLRTDTPAYSTTTSGGLIDSVTFQGNTGVREVEIGPYIENSTANRVEASIPGSDPLSNKAIFETRQGDLFSSLMRLRDQLLAGENPVSVEAATANPGPNTLTVARDYTTGASVSLQTTGTLPGPLVPGVTYYAIDAGGGQIQLATSYENAMNGVAINLADAGTGEHSISKDSLGELNRALDNILSMRAEVGARLQRVDLSMQLTRDQQAAQAGTLAAAQDVDVAQITMEMAQQQTAYQAALRVIATTMQTSLVDYL